MRLITALLATVVLLSGCANSAQAVISASPASQASELGTDIKDIPAVTPYQYLNLFAANAENFSFKYTVKLHETDKTEQGEIYKKSGMFAEFFTTDDENSNTVKVREIEKENGDYFVIESRKMIAVYKAPASEMLLNKMLRAAKEKPYCSYAKGDYSVSEHKIPFEQDNSTIYTYRFYMKNMQLAKLELLCDDILQKTYEFTPIEQDTADSTAFELPKDYEMQFFDCPFRESAIYPWCKSGGV
ncbi:MAG TPA: hypothetical protein DCP97_00985 [Ruminococcaceae bacterium]|nr:hypothetical protein [Oscillospiraceae bacterium]